METERRTTYRNRILASLAQEDLALLQSHLEPLELTYRQRLEQPNKDIQYVYFPESGLASIIPVSHGDGRQAEAGVVGFEGMTGLAVVHGADRSPADTSVQVPGNGHRIGANELRGLAAKCPTMTKRFLHYAHVFTVQVAYTALANAVGTVEERLSRWLLMAHDRLGVAELKVTHDFLAFLLGVRRPAITIALQRLESRGLLSTTRGVTLILDRDGIVDCAHSFYGAPEAEYQRLFQTDAALV